MSEKDHLLSTMEREFATTLRVMEAYPHDQHEFKPHERSRSALELASTLSGELHLVRDALDGNIDFSKESVHETALDWADAISRFKAASAQTIDKLKNTPDDEYLKMVSLGEREVKRIDAMWIFMFDQIHHRGQLSVYVRMAGGKVPSIYGPSADSKE